MGIIDKIIAFFKGLFNKKKEIPVKEIIYEPYKIGSFDFKLLDAINQYRVSVGLGLVVIDVKLSAVSNSHTQRMVQDGFASHNGAVDRQKSYPNSIMSEIVGYGYKSEDGFLNAWLKSPSHKVALDRKNAVKVGIATSLDAKGKIYATVIFIN